MKGLKYIFFIAFWQLTSALYSSQIYNDFVNFTALNGLSHGAVNDILQDQQGFLWFATNNGLNMYNGKSFEVYQRIPGDTNSIQSNYITKIEEDSKGNIWIGTNTGLNILQIKTNVVKRIRLEKEYYITEIIQIDSSHVAVSTYNGLLIFNINNETYDKYVIDNLQDNRYRVMMQFRNNLMIFAEGGIYTFDYKARKFGLLLKDANGFLGDDARNALMHNNTLWVGTTDNGVFFNDFNENNKIERFDLPVLNNKTIYASFKYSERQLVFACENNGLIIIDPEQRHAEKKVFNQVINQYNQPNGLVNNSVYTIFRDVQNNLWLGTYNGISCQYGNGMNFSSLSSQLNNNKTLFNNMVNCILEVDNTIWIGTENGIDIIESESGEVVKHIDAENGNENSLLAAAVLDMEFDSEGNIWVGSWAGGIDVFNRNGNIIKKYNSDNTHPKLSNNSVMCVSRDMLGNMWVGTMGGGISVFSNDGNKVRYYKNDNSDPNSLDNDWIKTILVSSKNEIWVSTHVGLELFDHKTNGFIHFLHSEKDTTSLAANGVVCMKEDKHGNIWFGTPSGLSLYNGKDSSFTNFYTSHGLVSNHILSIEEDGVGNMWFSCHSGLSKLVAGSFLTKSPVFENYDNRDGIISDEFIRRASCKTQNKGLCFGTRKGVVFFDPLKIITNSYIPEVYITEIYVNNNKLKAEETGIIRENARFVKQIKLRYDQSHFSFDFAALNYVVPGKNKYKYKLVGFENEWIDYDGSRATYTNIPPGEYLFHVVASNNSEVWNMEGAKISITITPPWYKTKAAFIGYLIIVFVLIFSYRYFIRRQTQLESLLKLEKYEKENLNKVNKMKTKFFTNISHEFLTPLALIISPLESLINNNEQLENSVKPIYRNAKRLQRLINQMLDISKIEADHLALKVSKGDINMFIRDIFISFKSMADSKAISFNYHSTIKNNSVYFDSDKIEKILYNLISNALKYTPNKGNVEVSASLENEHLVLTVSDSGVGIDENDKEKIFESFYRTKESHNAKIKGTGIGLSLVKGLVNVYGGELILKSEAGKGSKFITKLPFKKESFNIDAIVESNTQLYTTLDIEEDFNGTEIINIDKKNFDDALPNVLIVEDNIELNRHLVELLNAKYNINSASDGQQGVSMAKAIIPDLIITDIVMPNMSGMELLKQLRGNEETSHIPVIMLTAKVDPESKIEGLESGADAYITKPFDQKHLETVIQNLVKNREKLKSLYKKNIVIEPTQVQITSVDEKFIERAIKGVEENISNPEFNVESLAQHVGMSRVQLHRKLTGLLGMSASNFIREIKIKRAAELLTKGQLTVSEVMYEVNIKSRAYFTKCFKETYGMLPTEYVKDKRDKV